MGQPLWEYARSLRLRSCYARDDEVEEGEEEAKEAEEASAQRLANLNVDKAMHAENNA